MTELLLPSSPLADDVVLLRPWRAADLPAKRKAYRDPELRRFSWSRAEPATAADAEASLRTDEQARLRGQALNFALVDARDEGVDLGGASLYDLNLETACAGVGYWLAPEARGRGAATRAVRLLTRWAFTTLTLARIELTCGPDNGASQRVAERCSNAGEGVLRSHLAFQGGHRDTALFSLLSGEGAGDRQCDAKSHGEGRSDGDRASRPSKTACETDPPATEPACDTAAAPPA